MVSTDIGIWIYVICFWGIMSFAFKETAYFRYAEYTWTGAAAGIGCVAVTQLFKDMVLTPVGAGDIGAIISYSIALLIGVLLFGRFSRRYGWTARIPTGIMLGVALGVSLIQTIKANLISMIDRAMLPLFSPDLTTNLLNLAGIIILLTSLAYFIFTIPFSKGRGAYGIIWRIGRYCLLMAIGVAVGQLLLGRTAILSGQLYKQMTEWLGIIQI